MLRGVDLAVVLGKRPVVAGVTIELKPGEVVGLLGPNGAGKTTVFYLMAGLIRPQKGDVFLDEKKVSQMVLAKRAKLGLSYLPQENSLFAALTVEENLRIAIEQRKLKKKERAELLKTLVQRFSLEKVLKSKAVTLSGGEKRKCELARCLAFSPKYLLLDEPFAGVDPLAVQKLRDLILLLKAEGIGVLITDHNVVEALKICDRAYLLHEGKILIEGPPEKIVKDQMARSLYFGNDFYLN